MWNIIPFSHEKVVIAQCNESSWFYPPTNANWLTLILKSSTKVGQYAINESAFKPTKSSISFSLRTDTDARNYRKIQLIFFPKVIPSEQIPVQS